MAIPVYQSAKPVRHGIAGSQGAEPAVTDEWRLAGVAVPGHGRLRRALRAALIVLAAGAPMAAFADPAAKAQIAARGFAALDACMSGKDAGAMQTALTRQGFSVLMISDEGLPTMSDASGDVFVSLQKNLRGYRLVCSISVNGIAQPALTDALTPRLTALGIDPAQNRDEGIAGQMVWDMKVGTETGSIAVYTPKFMGEGTLLSYSIKAAGGIS